MLWDRRTGKTWQSLRPESLRREVDGSLRRLQVDVIDLYQIHWPDPDPDIEEAWSTLADLRHEGKVRYIGVSNFSVEQMRRVLPIAPIASLQPPYSLVRPASERDILPFCQAHSIGVITYSPMMSGLLTDRMSRAWVASLPRDDARSKHPEFSEPRLSRNLGLVQLLRGIAQRHQCTVSQVAIAWVLRHPAVSGAIVGVRRPAHIDAALPAAALRLDEGDLAAIEHFLAEHP
jgi:aryl-alcohol dehydrogenase-like predicted oxidoreductase